MITGHPTPPFLAGTWNWTYTSFGRVLVADGPRTDVADTTTFTYFPDNDACSGCRGQVKTATNAIGHVTTYNNYDADGRLAQVTDPNGMVSTMTYHPRHATRPLLMCCNVWNVRATL